MYKKKKFIKFAPANKKSSSKKQLNDANLPNIINDDKVSKKSFDNLNKRKSADNVLINSDADAFILTKDIKKVNTKTYKKNNNTIKEIPIYKSENKFKNKIISESMKKNLPKISSQKIYTTNETSKTKSFKASDNRFSIINM